MKHYNPKLDLKNLMKKYPNSAKYTDELLDLFEKIFTIK
jgi:hypothetical protein